MQMKIETGFSGQDIWSTTCTNRPDIWEFGELRRFGIKYFTKPGTKKS